MSLGPVYQMCTHRNQSSQKGEYILNIMSVLQDMPAKRGEEIPTILTLSVNHKGKEIYPRLPLKTISRLSLHSSCLANCYHVYYYINPLLLNNKVSLAIYNPMQSILS